MIVICTIFAVFAVGIALKIILDSEESQTAARINKPHDIEAKISEEVDKEYGKNTAWYYLGKNIVEENSADILVNKNGCLIYRTVVLFDPSPASKEPRKQQKQRQEQPQAHKPVIEQQKTDFSPEGWFSNPKIKDAVRALMPETPERPFLILEEYLPDKKYWEEIINKKYVLGFSSAKILNNGIEVTVD